MPPVIPGAPNSFGMSTRAAYGNSGTPTVYKITSLGDTGLSTQFRHAAEASGNRVIIFEVGGYIALNATVTITNSYLTIAGQTAPAPGITFINYGLEINNATDILVQHIKIRPGGDTCNSSFQAYGGNQHNIVLDHVSMTWGQDENMATTRSNGQGCYLTTWRCLFGEGLWRAPGSGGCSGGGFSNGHGFLVESGSLEVAMIQCLFASNIERNPYMQGDTRVVLLNNLIYQWHGPWGFFFNNADPDSTPNSPAGPWYASVAGNRFVKGPHTSDGEDAYMFLYSANEYGQDPGNAIYKADNTIANPDGTIIFEANQYSYDPNVGSPPSQTPLPSGYTILASTATEAAVLASCGARPVERDDVDTRIVATVTNRNGAFITHPNDVGGYPSLTPTSRSLTVPSNPNVDSGNGYTNLEVWLQGYAAGVEGDATSPSASVSPSASKSPSASASASVSPSASKSPSASVSPSASASPSSSVHRNVAGGRTFLSATFTGTAGTNLTDLGGWALHPSATGILKISDAGRILNSSTGVGGLTLSTARPVSNEFDLTFDIRVLTLISGSSISVWGRVDPLTDNGLFCGYDVDALAWQIQSLIAGTYTVIGSFGHVLDVATSYLGNKFVIRNDGLELWVAGTGIINSDAVPLITAAGRVGIAAYAGSTADSNTTGIHVDNVIATDVRTYPYLWPKGGGV